ncbi:MAG: hypothetical protein U1A78_26690 [Polyangia bacterium]
MRRYSSSDPFTRGAASNSREALERCEVLVFNAWKNLAQAGAPRLQRAARQKKVDEAVRLQDEARAHMARGSSSFLNLTRMVADKAQAQDWYRKPAPHEKGAITSLQPLWEELRAELRDLSACIVRHRNGDATRPPESAERRHAHHVTRYRGLGTYSTETCAWCGEAEATINFFALDEGGFIVAERERARRFCCWRCFDRGEDLIQPAPPLRAAPARADTVTCEEVRALPDRPRAFAELAESTEADRG